MLVRPVRGAGRRSEAAARPRAAGLLVVEPFADLVEERAQGARAATVQEGG